ncbi:glycoside hydrolase [Coprinopsis sp. MPI-PUGE-AT-0042]|nr:glycoside hydrolase [Coprinopsis sp. MPI-PUGE-AT-0042]
MPSTLPTRRNPLVALITNPISRVLVTFWQTNPALASPLHHLHRRPLALIVDTGSLEQSWGKMKQQVPRVNNRRSFLLLRRLICTRRGYVEYTNHAYLRDEFLFTSGGRIERINRWSLTAVEAFSTIWPMDIKTGFWRTVGMLERKTFTNDATIYPFFETTVRYLGGYLSAYTFSCEKLLLTLTDDIGTPLCQRSRQCLVYQWQETSRP